MNQINLTNNSINNQTNLLQVISKEMPDQSTNETANDESDKEDKNEKILQLDNQINQVNNQINNQLNNQLTNQINEIASAINDLDKKALNNLAINSITNTNITSDINANSSNSNLNLNINSTTTATKNDFVIISVLKKQGVSKARCQSDVTATKKVCFSDGIRPGDESIIEQRTSTLLPNLITAANLNANLMANLTATSQMSASRISFKPFLAHSQLTYAQKGLLLNAPSTTTGHQRTSSSRTSSKRHHLSSSSTSTHRHQLAQQKLIQLSATSASLRNTAATYTVLTKTGSKLNQSNKQHLINSTRSNSNHRKFVYLTNGKLLVNSYSNYNDFYIKNNDMFQNENFTSYVLLA